jgi:hypothetical protein
MTIQLNLPPELEARLEREAQRQNSSPDAVTLKLLNDHLPPVDKAAALAAMFEQWNAEDEAMTDEEQAENIAILRAIDEDRMSDRKLFTDILKDCDQ